MTTSFSQKLLTIKLTLISSTFDGENNTTVLSGLRTEVHIEKGGHPSKNTCKVKIYGMPEHDMNALTRVSGFKPLAANKSFIQVLAGDKDGYLPQRESGVRIYDANLYSFTGTAY